MKNTLISLREKEVLYLISQELTAQEISQELHLSYHTVHSHRKNLMLKLGAKNSAGLVRVGFEKGILHVAKSIHIQINT